MNQVAATVFARYHRKQLPKGKAVYGVFTRDYRLNTLNSQVSKRDKQHSRQEGISSFLSKQNTHGRRKTIFIISDLNGIQLT